MARSDKHLLLDVSVIINLWLGSESAGQVEDILDKAQKQCVPVWISASSISTLDYVARKRFKQASIDPDQIETLVSGLMANLLETVGILTNYGFEQKELYQAARDFEDAQITVSARSLAGASVCLVSEDKGFDALGEVPVYTPSEALSWLREAGTAHDTLPFIDLAGQQHLILPEIEKGMTGVLRHGQYIMGPEVVELEKKLADYTGVSHCISVAGGTDALLIALMALGIGPGDEVITTPFTFIATAETIALLGATPRFVDIDERTLNIDPKLIEAAIGPRTKAILPVSLYGQCADFDVISIIAERHGIPVIEDAAQSFGATYKRRKSCALATIGCTSFFPTTPLGCYGDGGACFTDDDILAAKMRQIRVHGQDRRYHHPVIGINGRIHTIQAAILLAKLEIFPDEVERRGQIGATYTRLLKDNVRTPCLESFNTSVYAQYTVLVEQRESIQEQLKWHGIPTAVHYPVPLHLQPAFSKSGESSGSFPIAEAAATQVMSLPMRPYLDTVTMEFIVETLKKLCSQ